MNAGEMKAFSTAAHGHGPDGAARRSSITISAPMEITLHGPTLLTFFDPERQPPLGVPRLRMNAIPVCGATASKKTHFTWAGGIPARRGLRFDAIDNVVDKASITRNW